MTNHWIDLKNTDCALIIGSNAAENHPVSFKWLEEARDKRGALIISVDPRFTRTASRADIYAPIRPGTDIVFIGGLINYVLQNNLFFRDYVVNYTNAAFLVGEKYAFSDGLFSGWDEKNHKYDPASWQFQTGPDKKPLKDLTMENPQTVLQVMKQHYSRYDSKTVSAICGMPEDSFLAIARSFGGTGRPGKSGTVMYAMGGTQHTVGTQNVRAYAILQLLLGNIGLPGGGVNALRGESNVQGSTDLGLLFNSLPGYLTLPSDVPEHATLEAYLKKETPKAGFWTNKPNFMVSLLKAWWGDKAAKENEFAFQYLPKWSTKKNYSHIALFEALGKGDIKGLLAFGQNPVVSGPDALREQKAMANLDWLVVADIFPTETALFWTREGGMEPKDVKTEVFLLPAAAAFEKEGSVTNSGRWVQWHWQALPPYLASQSDAWIVNQLALRLQKAYAGSTNPVDRPVLDLYWPYGANQPDLEMIAKEMNGFKSATLEQLTTFLDLKNDGSTTCGCWIYGGMYPPAGNRAKSRVAEKEGIGSNLGWAFAWPANRRILYNRASADPAGRPWSDDKKVIWWQDKWAGLDIPDFKPTVAPTDPGGTAPFIMLPDGVGVLFAPAGLTDGPLPEHYEPFETPLGQNPLSRVNLDPAVKVWDPGQKGTPDKYPCVATTYRLSEQWQAGAMTRNTPWLDELMPYMFVEISESLARQKGVQNGDMVWVMTTRGQIQAYALVTSRLRPLLIEGRPVEMVGLPWHWGFHGLVTGGIANRLTPLIGDANTMIPEYKAFLCDVRKVV